MTCFFVDITNRCVNPYKHLDIIRNILAHINRKPWISFISQSSEPLARITAVHSCKHAGCVQGRLVVDGLRGGAADDGAVSRPEDHKKKQKDKKKSVRQGGLVVSHQIHY